MYVASTGGNNGFWFGFVLGIIREIELKKDLVLEDFESIVRSIVEEDSSSVENSLREKYQLIKASLNSFHEVIVPSSNSFIQVTNLNEIGNVSVRIGSDSPIKLIIPNHFHVGTLDMEMIGNRELDYSGTRSWCNVPSARPHRLVIGINDGYRWGIGWSFDFRFEHVDLGFYDEKFFDERLFDIRFG
ncbi:hypothetical protein Tco_1126266 [Tanacetum coccineum]